MLISLLELYSHINSADLTLMVCDDSFPGVDYIKNRLLGGGSSARSGESESFRDQSGEIMNISSENTEVFEDLIKTITEFFDFIDRKYFFTWEPYGIYTEIEYEVAYAYTYFNLCENPNVHSFICDFTKDERSGSHEKSNSMTNVITAMGSADAVSFADLLTKKAGLFTFTGIDGYDRYTADGMKVVSLTHQNTPVSSYVGSIEISDLSKPATFSNWKPGAYTEYISMASVGDGTRSLKAMMTLPYYSSEFAEIVYLFDRPADLSPIHVITFSLMIDTASSDTSGEYTVRTVIGGENMSTVAESTVRTADGERFLLSVDVSSLTEMKNTYYIKICVQNNSGRDDEIITNVLSVSAYSNTHTDEELKEIFSASDNTLSDKNDQSASDKWRSAAIVILFAVAIFTVLAIFIYRKTSLEDSEE